MTKRRLLVVAGVTLLVSVVLAGIALAQESFLDGKIRTGSDIVVSESVSGNLYVFAGQVTINGTVDGDLTVVGGQATINGIVTGDVLVAAGNATITGDIGGDVRTVTGLTVIEGAVSGDVMSSSGRLQIRAGSSIGQDLMFATGQTVMNGTVEGGVVGSTGDYSVAGAIEGSQDVTVAEPPAQRSFTDRALHTLSRFMAVVLVAALAAWLFPKTIDRVTGVATDRPLPSLGWGAVGLMAIGVGFIGTIVVSVLVTLLFAVLSVGSLIGLTWFSVITAWVVAAYGIYVLAAFLAPIVMGAVAGYLIVRPDEHSWGTRLAAIAVGLVIVIVLTSLGVVGGLIGFLFFVVALGAMILLVRDRRNERLTDRETTDAVDLEATAES